MPDKETARSAFSHDASHQACDATCSTVLCCAVKHLQFIARLARVHTADFVLLGQKR